MLKSGKEILHLRFGIWPDRGQPIETTFRAEFCAYLRKQDPDYQSWMISVSYEVEESKPTANSAWNWRLVSRA
jgi:hypothetical protein